MPEPSPTRRFLAARARVVPASLASPPSPHIAPAPEFSWRWQVDGGGGDRTVVRLANSSSQTRLPPASITLSGPSWGPGGEQRFPPGRAATAAAAAAAAAAVAAATTAATASSCPPSPAASEPSVSPAAARPRDDADAGGDGRGRRLRLWPRFRRKRRSSKGEESGGVRRKQRAAAATAASSSSSLPRQQQQPFSLEATLNESVRPALLRLGEALGPGRLLVAGALSAVVSRTAVAPLERVKMELQLRSAALAREAAAAAAVAGQQTAGGLLKAGSGGAGGALRTALAVLREEGLTGFWRGHGVNVLRTAPHKAVNFACFDVYSQVLLGAAAALLTARAASAGASSSASSTDRSSSSSSSSSAGHEKAAAAAALARFSAGALAGVTATLTCYPLDVLRTRICAPGGAGAVDAYRKAYGCGPLGVLVGIARNEGPRALYAGCLPAVVGMVPAGAVFYGVFAALKDAHLAREQAAYGQWLLEQQQEEERRRQRAEERRGGGRRGRRNRSSGFATTAEDAESPASSAAATASRSQHRQRRPTRRQPPKGELPVGATLLYGAAAGAASELIVYPLEVVRRRMQLQQAASAAAAAGLGGGAGALRAVAGAAAGAGGAAALSRVAAACLEIMRQRGVRGLYSGLGPNLLQVLPSSALSYYTFETAKVALGGPAGGGEVQAMASRPGGSESANNAGKQRPMRRRHRDADDSRTW